MQDTRPDVKPVTGKQCEVIVLLFCVAGSRFAGPSPAQAEMGTVLGLSSSTQRGPADGTPSAFLPHLLVQLSHQAASPVFLGTDRLGTFSAELSRL